MPRTGASPKTLIVKVLIACEFSCIVRDAFRALGHDAWSCDLLPCEGDPKWHLQQDVLPLLGPKWDLMIAHPPCTYLCSSGARWWSGRQQEQKEAIIFVKALLDAPIERICLENPVGKLSTVIRKPDQIVQPWMFGHGEIKSTCLWLKGLPLLTPTNIVSGRKNKCHFAPDSKDRWKARSRTLPGLASAMAEQWGRVDL